RQSAPRRIVRSFPTRRSSDLIQVFRSKIHRWTPDDDKLLGSRPDDQIALLLGASVSAVKHRRVRLGIVQRRLKVRRWTREEDALLGTASDGRIAQGLGRGKSAVADRRR